MAGHQRQYSDDEKSCILAYHEACGNEVKTAARWQVPRTTLRQWLSNPLHPDVRKDVIVKKLALAEKLEVAADALLDGIITNAGSGELNHQAIALGIVIDKTLLLKGQPTAISQALPPEDREKRIGEILEAARARK